MNRVIKYPICLALVLLSACPWLHAATFLTSFQPAGSLTLSAQKGLDLDGWEGKLDLNASDQEGNRARIYQTIDVKLHRLQDYLPQWKLNQQLRIEATHPYDDNLELVLTGEAGEFRDQFARRHPSTGVDRSNMPTGTAIQLPLLTITQLDEQRIRDGRIGAGSRWNEGNFSVEALVGFLNDNRGEKNRSGFRVDISATQSSDSLRWMASGWLARFPDGSDHDLRAEMNGEYSFGQEAQDQFGVSYVSGRRFDISLTQIEAARRDDKRFNLTNRLLVEASKEIGFSWESEVNNQTASRNAANTTRSDREFVWKNGAEMTWTTDRQSAALEGGIDVQQQKYAGSITEGQRSRLGLEFNRQVGSYDTLGVHCSVLKYRYDTPEEQDHNDRDELRFISGFAVSHSVTPAFRLRTGIGADLSHIVYISGSRSGENRWTRQFSLFAETPWKDPPIANVARFSIISHYTDYDFAPFDETASRVFRTASATDTLKLDFGKGWNCQLSLAGELNDHGSLVWDEWMQNIAEEGYAYTIVVLPGFSRPDVSLSAGWVYHRRSSTLRSSTSTIFSGQSVRSSGPSVMLSLRPTNGFSLEASGTTMRVHDRERGDYTLPDLRLTLNWMI